MIYRKLLIIIAGLLSIALISCKENPSSVGLNLLTRDLIGAKLLDSNTDSLKQSSSYFQKTIPLGGGSTLFLGKVANVEASVLLKFYFPSLPDSIVQGLASNAVTVSSATVSLYPIYNLGDTTASLDFSVHQINSDWTSEGFDADSLQNFSYNSADVSSNRTITDSVTTFDVPGSLIQSWIQSYADSNLSALEGLYIKPSAGSQRIVGYEALSIYSSKVSQLRVIFEKAGVYDDTVFFTPVTDVSVVKATLPQVSSTNLIVQGGTAFHSKLAFDVSKIPQHAIINQAILTLNIDTAKTVSGSNNANSIVVWNLSDSASSLIDSAKYVPVLRNGSTFSGNIAALVQKWIDSQNNQGLLIQDNNQIGELELYILNGSSDSNLALRPRLKILYTIRN